MIDNTTKEIYCPLYEDRVTEYGCSEICYGVEFGRLANDGMPSLPSIEITAAKRNICMKCPCHSCKGSDKFEIDSRTKNKQDNRMADDEIRKRLSIRQFEYFMFMDDE